MTLHFGRRFGIAFRIMPDALDRTYVTAVIWYPRSRTTQGYLYPAIRWPF